MKNKRGFTLVEVLLVVVIIAILAAIVIVAINPARQIAQANNTQRQSDVSTILNAIHEYGIDNRGVYPAGIPDGDATPPEVADLISNDGVNICSVLVPTYIAEMPFDPTAVDTGGNPAQYTSCTDYYTGYTVLENGGRVTVAAPGAELGATISVTK